jgi:hypothetical protein
MPLAVPTIAAITLILLSVDIYPSVKSFRGMLNTPSFLLFWLVSFLLTTVAYFFLMTTALVKIQGLVGVEATKLTAVLLAWLMQATILQSLSFKFSDVQIINLQSLIANYRAQVLEDITKKNSELERLAAFRIADRLSEKFIHDEDGLLEEYSQLLLYTGQSAESVAAVIAETEANANNLNISKIKLIAGRIARLDRARAKQLLAPPRR